MVLKLNTMVCQIGIILLMITDLSTSHDKDIRYYNVNIKLYMYTKYTNKWKLEYEEFVTHAHNPQGAR